MSVAPLAPLRRRLVIDLEARPEVWRAFIDHLEELAREGRTVDCDEPPPLRRIPVLRLSGEAPRPTRRPRRHSRKP